MNGLARCTEDGGRSLGYLGRGDAGHAGMFPPGAMAAEAGRAGHRVLQYGDLPSPGAPLADEVGAAEQGEHGRADGGGQMGWSGIAANGEVGLFQQCSQFGDGEGTCQVVDAWPRSVAGDGVRQGTVLAGAYEDDGGRMFDDQASQQFAPVGSGPALGGGAGSQVEHEERRGSVAAFGLAKNPSSPAMNARITCS